MFDCNMSFDYDNIYPLSACLWFVQRWLSHPAIMNFLETFLSVCLLTSKNFSPTLSTNERQRVEQSHWSPAHQSGIFFERERERMGYLWGLHRWDHQICASQILLEKYWEGTVTAILANMLKGYFWMTCNPRTSLWLARYNTSIPALSTRIPGALCTQARWGQWGDTDSLELSALVRCQHTWRMKTEEGCLITWIIFRENKNWGVCLQYNTV